MQPFIFSDILHIPAKQQGQVGGMLAAARRAMSLIFICFAGALSDIRARKALFVLALTSFAFCAAAASDALG